MKNYFKVIRKFEGGGNTDDFTAVYNAAMEEAATNGDIEAIAAQRQSQKIPTLDKVPTLTTASLPSELNITKVYKPKEMTEEELSAKKARDAAESAEYQKLENTNSSMPNGGLSDKGADIMGKVSNATRGAITAVSDSLLKGKNFDVQSQSIDQVANAAADFASQFGPWGKVAGLAITALNEGTKMFGQNVQGYNVNVDNSGYAQSMMSQESKANRIWISQREIDRQLQAKNHKLSMALHAQDISEDIKFEQTARANSIDNVIRNNQIALAGGLETAALAAKRGGKLERVLKHRPIVKEENGAKLEKIELSEEENIIPEGELHKNKHHIDLEGITQKGIPVVTTDTDADTFIEIKNQEDSIVIHAEIEKEEVIFTKELTDFVEEKLKEWNESDNSKILEEVGKRITKELLFNTNDRAELIDTLR